MTDPLYYQQHVFFCTNRRDNGNACCADRGAEAAQQHAKRRIHEMDLNGAGKIRINKSGCLDACERGCTVVVYPEGVWYGAVTKDDVKQIVEDHLVGGKPVERLRMKPYEK